MGTPNYILGTGRMVPHITDFEGHVSGTAYRHTADEIDLQTPIVVNSQSYFTVSSALNAIETANAGTVFTVFPDGYDTYHASDASVLTGPPNQNFPYDSSIPSIDGLLNDIFSNPNNPLHHRLRDGGVIVIPAGTYIVKNTINVPNGTVIMGEGFGTKIINQTVSASFPYGQPLFAIAADTRVPDLGVISGGSTNKPFMFARDNIFTNLVIADNFVEPKFVGDTSYYTPQNTSTTALVSAATNATPIQITTAGHHNFVTGNTVLIKSVGGNTNANGSFAITVIDQNNFTLNGSAGNASFTTDGYAYGIPAPLIFQSEGSSVICDNVKFIGKVTYNSSQPNFTTGSAIGTNSSVTAANGTALSVRNCIFDGFAIPISFTASGGVRDRLYCNNNKIRCFGSANVVPSGTAAGSGNGFGSIFTAVPIATNLCSMNVSSNYLYTNYIDSIFSLPVSMVFIQQSNLPMTSLVFSMTGNAVSPIVVTTISVNNYKTGQTVTLTGVGGNTNANATAVITVVDTTHFSLNGTTGNGSYTSGGIITTGAAVNVNISGNEITTFNSSQVAPIINQRLICYYTTVLSGGSLPTLFGVVNSSIYGNVDVSSKDTIGPLSLNLFNIGAISPYTIVGDEALIIIPSTSPNATINIPSSTMLVGQEITIKNLVAGGSVNITIHRLDVLDKIETVLSDYSMTTNLAVIRLVSDGNHNWMLV